MNKLRYSPESKQDLQDIKTYIANELLNPTAAARITGDILKRIQSLLNFPKMGTPLTTVLEIDTDYRFLVCGHYVVFYLYHDKTISVMRVLYGKRDFMKILFNEFNGKVEN